MDDGRGRRSRFSALVSWSIFPVVLGGALTAGSLALLAGHTPTLVVAALMFVAAVVIFVFERVQPYEAAWRRSHGDVRTDATHTAVSMIALPELFGAALFGGMYAASAALSDWLGVELWPSRWPLVAQLALAAVVGELGQYWGHRWCHERPLLWRLHAVHHSAPRLYWLNAGRFHPLDTLFTYALSITPLVLLGATAPVLALFTLLTGIHGMFQHANIQLRLGPLNWIFSMAELHRWHHSRTIDESNTNYGANLIVFDVVFGTRYLPKDREPPRAIGIADLPAFPGAYIDQLAVPFRWRSLLAAQPSDHSAVGEVDGDAA